MIRYLPAIFSLLVAAAGWFYLFYSRAAHNLSGIEDPVINRRRMTLRRVGGVAMFLLAIAFFAGFYTFDPSTQGESFLVTWVAVLVLLMAITVLGLLDLRMTWQLRKRSPRRGSPASQGDDPETRR